MKKPIDVPLLFKLWHDESVTNRELAERLDIAVSRLWEMRKRYGLPPRKYERKEVRQEDDPTPEEIERGCAAARRKWTKTEEALRRVGHRYDNWSVPEYTQFDRQTMTFRA